MGFISLTTAIARRYIINLGEEGNQERDGSLVSYLH